MKQNHRPKLGQHFLTDESYRRRIVDVLDLRSDELVIEIGPGRGAMTHLLAERAHHVTAIELDSKLANVLREQARQQPRIEVIQGDVLSADIADMCRRQNAHKCFVFGNLPYYITSPIIHHLFRFVDAIRSMAVLVQLEVADRLTANPGSRAYGYLSVLAQLHSEPRITLNIPPGAFTPHPKVQSALVVFQMKQSHTETQLRPKVATVRFGPEKERFLTFVKSCFAHKRKNLVNNLTQVCARKELECSLTSLGLPLTIRAEQLTLEQFALLFHALC